MLFRSIAHICAIFIFWLFIHNSSRMRERQLLLMIDYSPLWETMKRKEITQYKLIKDKVLDNRVLDTLRKNNNITMLTLEKLCHALDCTPNDIVRFPTDE